MYRQIVASAAALATIALLSSGCNGLQSARRDADLHYQRGQWSEALVRYRDACRKYSWVVSVCFKWGLVAQRLKRYDEAKEAYRLTLRANPRIPSVYNNLGAIAWIQRELSDAERHFRKAIELDPSNSVEAHNNLAMVLLRKGQTKLALEELVHAKNKWPKPQLMSTLQVNLGRAYFQLGKFRESLSEYLQALESDPNNVHAHNNLGVIYAKMQQFQNARLHLSITLKLRPDDVAPYYNLGIVAFLEGKYGQSVQSNKDALRHAPRYVRAYNNMAMAYYRLGDFKLANDALQESLRIDNRYGAAYNGLAVLAIARSRYGEAIRLLSKAIDLTPRVATFHFNLGLTYFKTKAYAKALSAFERAQELDPEFPGVQENIKALRNLIDNRSGGSLLPYPRIRWRLGGGQVR
ncbi:MAG: tetratricopeptide repeat protein [Myxococcales bacterium]|nr:tetratricopeptide repeat protein [Myxococcales bacterium]